MPIYRTGLNPSPPDTRVPALAELAALGALPSPPPEAEMYAGIGNWGMLGNDRYGCCVEAMVAHQVRQVTHFMGAPIRPTEDETLALYAAVTGFDVTNPATDQGTVMLGPGGMMEHWVRNGVAFGGVTTKCVGYASIKPDPLHLRQAVCAFGGFALGIKVPAHLLEGPDVPYVWTNASGPIDGGHEVWVDGYVGGDDPATMRFDVVSWGARYRMSWAFMEATFMEAVAIIGNDMLGRRGISAQGFDLAALEEAMKGIRGS